MFEGIVLMIFLVAGGLTALLALLYFCLSAARKSKKMFILGGVTSLIPISIFALCYWFYHVHIPAMIRQEENLYVGTYVMVLPGKIDTPKTGNKQRVKIILKSDNSFLLDKNSFTPFHGAGSWKAGATADGQFEFRDLKKTKVFYATASNSNMLEINKKFNNKQGILFLK